MKKTQLIAIAALTAVAAAGVTIYLMRKERQDRRKKVVSNAGYEMAYDINYPLKYSGRKRNTTR